jgi:amidase
MADHDLDVLAYPTIRRKAAPLGEPQQGSNCHLSAISGMPAVTVPAGYTPDGMPAGIELLGRPWSDAELLGYAYDYEQATRHRRAPELP